jgi:hypothetical protein
LAGFTCASGQQPQTRQALGAPLSDPARLGVFSVPRAGSETGAPAQLSRCIRLYACPSTRLREYSTRDYIMGDETSLRSGDEGDAKDGAGGSAGEPASLQGRAPLLTNWDWQSVVRINERLCGGGRAQHGKNSETHARCAEKWSEGSAKERTLLETLDWLRSFHRQAPFLFFNGNTFAEIARTLTDALFAEFPRGRRREAASLAAHYVAGVLDRVPMVQGIVALAEAAEFKPGDHVKTLKGSLQGVVRKILPDGRVAWRPDGSETDLVALPESLLRRKK